MVSDQLGDEEMLRVVVCDDKYIEIYTSENAYDNNYDLLLQGSELSVDVELDLIFYNKPELKDYIPMHNLEIVVTDDKTKEWIDTIKEYLSQDLIDDYYNSFIEYSPLTPPDSPPNHGD